MSDVHPMPASKDRPIVVRKDRPKLDMWAAIAELQERIFLAELEEMKRGLALLDRVLGDDHVVGALDEDVEGGDGYSDGGLTALVG